MRLHIPLYYHQETVISRLVSTHGLMVNITGSVSQIDSALTYVESPKFPTLNLKRSVWGLCLDVAKFHSAKFVPLSAQSDVARYGESIPVLPTE